MRKAIKIEKHSSDIESNKEINKESNREIQLLNSLDNPHIVKYYDHFELEIFKYNMMQVKTCIVTEYCEVV